MTKRDITLHPADPFWGFWTGPAPEVTGGLVQVKIAQVDATGVPQVTFNLDSFNLESLVPELTSNSPHISGESLRAEFGPLSLSLKRESGYLRGVVTSSILPHLEFVLGRNHPGAAAFLSPTRASGMAQPTKRSPMGEKLISEIENGELPWVTSLQVISGGEWLLDEYFYGRSPQSLHSLQSTTKSITALAFGVLVADDLVDLDRPVWTYLTKHAGTPWVDERYDISVHDVLAMTTNLDWREDGVSYFDKSNDAVRMNMAPDWVKFVLSKRLNESKSKEFFEYKSGLSMLLGELIECISGSPVDEVAAERLFGPMGIERYHWMTSSNGTRHTGGGLWLRPRDFAKFGELVLAQGNWRGQQLIPQEWIQRCIARQSGPDGEHPQVSRMLGYGYQWWLLQTPVPGRDSPLISASATGSGGQVMHVLPELDTVVVANAHDWLGDGHSLADRILDRVVEFMPVRS